MSARSGAEAVESEGSPYLDDDNFVSREIAQGDDAERRLKPIHSPYTTAFDAPSRSVDEEARPRSVHSDAALSPAPGGPWRHGGDGSDEVEDSFVRAETGRHEDGSAEGVEEALAPTVFVDVEVVPEGESPTYDEEYIESHAGVVGPYAPLAQRQAGGGGTTALAAGAAAIGNLLWQVAPAGFRIAIYDPGNKEFERRAADWATRERAVGHTGKKIDATTLRLDQAVADSSGLVKVVSEVSAAAKVAVAATARPQGAVPLAGTGPDLVRSLAIFSHGSRSWVGIGNGITKANAAEVVRRIASALTNDVQVILYGCSSGRGSAEPGGGWQQTTMRVGGGDSIAAAVRDALVDQGKTGATVWAHTQVGHTTRNPSLRFFSASSGKWTDGRSYAGEFVFGTVEKIAALGELEQAVRGLGFTIEDADQEKLRDHAYKLLEKHMYQAYVQAVVRVETRRDGTKVRHTNLTFRGANLPEVSPLYPLDVADVLRKHWQQTYWTPQRQQNVARDLARNLKLKTGTSTVLERSVGLAADGERSAYMDEEHVAPHELLSHGPTAPYRLTTPYVETFDIVAESPPDVTRVPGLTAEETSPAELGDEDAELYGEETEDASDAVEAAHELNDQREGLRTHAEGASWEDEEADAELDETGSTEDLEAHSAATFSHEAYPDGANALLEHELPRRVAYDGAAAIAYARAHWQIVCNDGFIALTSRAGGFLKVDLRTRFVHEFDPATGASLKREHALLPDGSRIEWEDIDDCTHFVSCCIGQPPGATGGGLPISYRQFGHPPKGPYAIVGVSTMVEYLTRRKKWAKVVGKAKTRDESLIKKLQPGDLIAYWSPERERYNHLALYLGRGKIACHTYCRSDDSACTWDNHWKLGTHWTFLTFVVSTP